MEDRTSLDAASELGALSRGLERLLERRADRGHVRVPLPERVARPRDELVPAPSRARAAEPDRGKARETREDSPLAAENRRRAAGCADLASLRQVVAACTACALHRMRTQTVFSDGAAQARILFIGEAPGQSEDEQGVPFVGRAGALLTDIITKGMGLDRRQVHIANILKCRPPENRDPLPEEKELCTPFLDRQIELVDPELIITLGLHAAHHVLCSPASMAKLRGRVHLAGRRKVVATYHPAFLLRSPHMKKECWKDIQLAMKELGLPVPG